MNSNTELLKQLKIDKSHKEAPGGGPPWGRIAVIAGVLVLLAAIGAGAWAFLGRRPVDVQTATAVAPASASEAGAVLQATGYVTARRQATVSAQITGTLTEVLIEEGDRVAKGQVLARLEDNALRASLQSAQAQAAAAHASVEQNEAQLDQALRDATRQEALVGRGLVSKQLAEQSRTQANTYRAQLNTSRRQAQAADSQVGVAQVNLDYTVVRAPFDGVITDKAAQVGEIVSPLSAGGGFTRTGVGTIVDMDSLEIDVDVNEAYIGRVQPNMAAEAVLDAYPDWRIPAHVIAIVPAADRGKATVKVRVAIEQKDGRIVPDMGVRVSFLEQRAAARAEVPKGAMVPASAIVQRDGHDVAFVVSDEKAHRREVTAAKAANNDVRLVTAGVSAGETVITTPPDTVMDGTAVRVTQPTP
ncbi:efflux RND transporter periplasmic adaptor subunit [Luteibacter aegosomatissinici]|uniref:efflux RND transporter periplasmic adaptor subunit n=1 Tax=Luteibacter aegosomatissinici TaxID=2911539 RepID=UPI001FF8F6A2|nr:efflux RND transporter periplasmic adaptor subunit [Luteibacter aegosomatissinici]UPG95079.1 efflux RND transporter periplasmic adaptor subunit [Luteibacter aegosomatissinici]